MNTDFNNNNIIEEIKNNGYSILEDFYSIEELNIIKKSLLDTLHYIKSDDEQDLQKKYYQIKKYSPKLKSHWYDFAPYNIYLLNFLHKQEIINIIKKFFKTEVVFSGRPCIHVHDIDNDKLLDPHQETSQFARDNILMWVPLYNTSPSEGTGGLAIYKDSHKQGYFTHSLKPTDSKKTWTKQYTHVEDQNIIARFERIELEVKAGSTVLMHSALIHNGYPTTKKDFVRITLTERFNPLQKIPFLKNENATMKIPFVGVDYNKIVD